MTRSSLLAKPLDLARLTSLVKLALRSSNRSRAANGTPSRVWKLPAKEIFLPSCW